jgi:hypothetical protein
MTTPATHENIYINFVRDGALGDGCTDERPL